MATHSRILAWRILWTEKSGGLQPIGFQRVRQNWSDVACMFVCTYIYIYIYIHTHIY